MVDFLFLLKDANINNPKKQISGLIKAAKLNSQYLNSCGYKSEAVSISDANYLDSILKHHQPKVVILEAVWVQPDKWVQIINTNPNVKKFIIRVHSDFPYFAIEGLGFNWLFESKKVSDKIELAANCLNFANNIKYLSNIDFRYLPNIYEFPLSFLRKEPDDRVLNIGIFGAIRLLKNHLIQAIAACRAGHELNRSVNLYINDLTSDSGQSILTNLNKLFEVETRHKLIIQKWSEDQAYSNAIHNLDLGLQLSFTESFNIVAADFVVNGVPVLGGETIEWLPDYYKCSYTNIDNIVDRIKFSYKQRNNRDIQQKTYIKLMEYNKDAKLAWNKFTEECKSLLV